MAIPISCPNAGFYCFLHEPGGDDYCIDGSLSCSSRHDCLTGARKPAVVDGGIESCESLKDEVSRYSEKLWLSHVMRRRYAFIRVGRRVHFIIVLFFLIKKKYGGM
jgi:hypothetical protein